MKKHFIALACFLSTAFAFAQNGLENIVVETYYVSNAADQTGSNNGGGGALPSGSVTYRIYADLLPGYKVQAMYGVAGHSLVFNTSTSFFNNEDRGSHKPNWTRSQANDNSVNLDSYLTIGGASTDQLGILKSEDVAGGMTPSDATMLQNSTAAMGFAISGASGRDGYTTGTVPTLNFVGITEPINALNNTNSAGFNSFTTSNGSIAVLGGFQGPTANNRVLLAQITTNGIFHYEINLQIGTPSSGVQNFVAASPVGAEISLGSLSGTLGVTSATEPGTPNGNISFASVTANSMTVNFTSGQGAKRIVVARAGGAVNSVAVDGSTYTANAQFGSGSQIGTGNYVVYAGTGNTVNLTGLTSGVSYGFAVFEYNDNNQSGAENYRTSTYTTGSQSTLSSVTYNWNNAAGGSWANAANWTPARTTPDVTDVLVFANGGSPITISNVPTQTVAKITVTSNTTINLTGSGTNTLTISGSNAGDDLVVSAGSSLNASALPAVSFVVASGSSAAIYGSMSTSTTGKLSGAAAGNIAFKSGSAFTTNAGFSGSPFGTSVNNAVVFESGASYVHNAGSNPFQASAPNSVVTFQSGSTQTFNTATGFDADKRSYSNLIINAAVSSGNTGTCNVANLTLGSSGSLTLTNSASGVLAITGNVTNNSTQANAITITGGSASFTGATAQSVSGSGTGALSFATNSNAGLTIASGTTLTFNKGFTCNNLTINGILAFGAANQTLNIGGTVAGTGRFAPFGSYDANLNFTSGTSAVGTINFGTAAMRNLTIDRTGAGATTTLTTALKVYGRIVLNNGNIASAGFLTLGSSANATACVPGNNTGSISGNVTVERYLPGTSNSTFHYISCPANATSATVSSQFSDDFPIAGTYPYTYSSYPYDPQPAVFPTVWTYNEALGTNTNTPGWVSASQAPINSSDLQGFAANTYYSWPITIDATGTLREGNFSSALTNSVNGFSLIGNPYPSPISWNLLFNLSGQASLTNAYYAWNAAVGNYGTWNGTIGTNNVTDTIYMGQAFFVKATAAGNLLMNNTIRRTSTAGTFFRNPVTPENLAKISISGMGLNDQLAVYSIAEGSDAYNVSKDVDRMVANPGDVQPEFFVTFDSRKLTIKEFQTLTSNKEVALGLVIKQSGMYTIRVDEFSNVTTAENSFLIDMLTNTRISLAGGNAISLYLEKGEYRNRFFLNKANPMAVEALQAASLEMHVNNNLLFISNNGRAATSTIEIFGMDGKLVSSLQQPLQNGVTRVEMPDLSSGVYMTRVASEGRVITGKYFIQ